jgi:hypothetical protein
VRGARTAVAAGVIALALVPAPTVSHAEPILARVEIGAQAPAFRAMGADGREHQLSDYAGRILVLEWMSPSVPTRC